MLSPLVIANWKMNPVTFKEAERLFLAIEKGLEKIKDTKVVICPPFTYLLPLKPYCQKKKTQLSLGAQNLFWEEKGAFTGEVSPLMLKDAGCQYVIIGHSERRQYLGETDEIVNRKIDMALKVGLNPILCLGEDEVQRDREETAEVVKNQLEKALENISSSRLTTNFSIAYEPIWAIGTGQTPNPDEILGVVLLIRKLLVKIYGRRAAEKIRVLYGGSVTTLKAKRFIKEAGIDGFLVGGASLNATEFISIIKTTIKS